MLSRRPIAANDGFSLIEVLVVVTIMALMASAAVLVLPSDKDDLEDAASDVRNAILALSRESVVSNRVLGLRFDGQGFAIAELRPEGWHMLDDDKKAKAIVAPASIAALVVEGNSVDLVQGTVFRPHIWFLPTGEQPGFDLALTYDGQTRHIVGTGYGQPEVRNES